MKKGNLVLLLFMFVMAIAWGVVYWVFFAENVIGG